MHQDNDDLRGKGRLRSRRYSGKLVVFYFLTIVFVTQLLLFNDSLTLHFYFMHFSVYFIKLKIIFNKLISISVSFGLYETKTALSPRGIW